MKPKGNQAVKGARKHMSYKHMKYQDFLKSKLITFG